MSLLAVCIPTYKRQNTLRRCIESVVSQIEKYLLTDYVKIYVANDASPDDTSKILSEFSILNYFSSVDRVDNLGMSENIKAMLEEASTDSIYQLIITDDDYLQPETLEKIVKHLNKQKKLNPDVSLLWTPRYSYTEDGELHCVECKTFTKTTIIRPSIVNSGRYMRNGFILSGLIVRSRDIDYSFWGEYVENAFFPVIFCGDLILRKSSQYWDMNIVHHTVLNLCHWERWGESDAEITVRLFIDAVNTYAVVGQKIKPGLNNYIFFLISFPDIVKNVSGFLVLSQFYTLNEDTSKSLQYADDVSFSKIKSPVNLLIIISILWHGFTYKIKQIVFRVLLLLPSNSEKHDYYTDRYKSYTRSLTNYLFVLRWIRAS